MTSSPPRLLVPGAALRPGALVPLPAEESRHVRARRLSEGDRVVLLDGSGARAEAVLLPERSAARVLVLLPAAGEPAAAVTVALAVSEPSRVEWAVEKGTECGAAAFLLFAAARSQEAHLRALSARLPRLRRVAAEATKQCDRTVVPRVDGPVPFRDVVSGAVRPVVALVPGAAPLMPGKRPGGGTLVVGPEGGLDAEEAAALAASGAALAGLGPRVLRLETAVVAGLVRLLWAEGEDPVFPSPPSDNIAAEGGAE